VCYLCAVFLGLSVLELGPMYVTDRRQTKHHLPLDALIDIITTSAVEDYSQTSTVVLPGTSLEDFHHETLLCFFHQLTSNFGTRYYSRYFPVSEA